MSVRVVFKGQSIKAQTPRAMNAHLSSVARAVTGAAREAAKEVETTGRRDISSAGRFGRRWTEGLQATVAPKTGALLNAKIVVTHIVPYFDIFESGGVITGKPLLWIPLSYTGITIRARDYARAFGGLFYVQPKAGRPLLLSIRDRKPKYFGIASVTITKRFHIEAICRNVMGRYGAMFANRLRG